jgi:hypothetical protein
MRNVRFPMQAHTKIREVTTMSNNQYTKLQASDVTVANLSKLRSTLSFTISDNLRFHRQLSLERLSYLASGDALLNQFEVNPKKALNFLLDSQIGLLVIGKLLTPIEVGVVYQSDYVDCQADLPEVVDDETDNEFTFTVSGRHRITGLLTWAYANGIAPKEVMIPVTVSYYQTWEDAALSVLAANASRAMTPTEKLNVTKQSQQIDTQDINQLAMSADSSKHAKEAFILMVSCPTVAEKLGLQRNTIASIARAFLTSLAQNHKGILTWFSNVEVLTKVGKLFISSLETALKTVKYTNVARYATNIGKLVYEGMETLDIAKLEDTVIVLEARKLVGTQNEQQQQQQPEQQQSDEQNSEQTGEPADDGTTGDEEPLF